MARPEGPAQAHLRLMDACWAHLTDPAADRPTVAGVCRSARCTAPTLYHHFDGLDGLIRSTSEREFALWAEAIAATVAAHRDPVARLAARGRAYVSWGVRHPDAYAALFLARGEQGPPGRGLGELIGDIAEARPDLQAPLVQELALTLWAGVHGLTLLATSHPWLPQDVVESTLARLLSLVTGGAPTPVAD